MTAPAEASDDATRKLRWAAYWLLIAIAAGNMTGRILAVNAVDRVALSQHLKEKGRDDWQKQRVGLSSNDRSRWAMIRALVEEGTYAIDTIQDEPGWDTIDMVQHRDREGNRRLYSSKPPLLPVLIAWEYWVIQKLTGTTMATHPYAIVRTILITVNVVPMIVMFWLIARMADRYATTDWGRLFTVAAATMGSFLNTFAVVLNNHTIAAVSATIALYATLNITLEGRRGWAHFLLAGLFGAFTVANELPALAFLCAIGLALLIRAPLKTLAVFAPAALVVAAGFFATAYQAHGTFKPPYAHRSEEDPDDNWYDYTYMRDGRLRESYWNDPQGIDRGEPSIATYAANMLVGHHGIFSLTPIWILSVAGMIAWIVRPPRDDFRWFALAVAGLTVVCLVFYIGVVDVRDRNYGGMTSGFRWMFWFAPLWLVTMIPAIDWMARSRVWQIVAGLLLAFSVMSASYPTWNPWTNPWIVDLLEYLGGPEL